MMERDREATGEREYHISGWLWWILLFIRLVHACAVLFWSAVLFFIIGLVFYSCARTVF